MKICILILQIYIKEKLLVNNIRCQMINNINNFYNIRNKKKI